MNGNTHNFLNLTALPAVGPLLLSEHAAFVFSADGSQVLWANAAGVAFFEDQNLAALGDRRFSTLNPLASQIARLARLLPSQTDRLEILRIGRGTRLTMMPAACRRLNLPQGERAVLVVATDGEPGATLRSRAERLAEVMAGPNRLVAVLDDRARVLGASGDPDVFEPAEDAIDDLIEAAASSDRPILVRAIVLDSSRRSATVVRLTTRDGEVFLVIIGEPEEPRQPAEIMAPRSVAGQPRALVEERPAPASAAPPGESATPGQTSTEIADDPKLPTAPVSRFVWETDADGRFTFVSDSLADQVGAANSDLLGRSWPEISDTLGFGTDLPDTARHDATWTATVYWPVVDRQEAIAVDLDGWALPSTGPDAAGGRGFGFCRPQDRRRDVRDIQATLVSLDVPSPETRAHDHDTGAHDQDTGAHDQDNGTGSAPDKHTGGEQPEAPTGINDNAEEKPDRRELGDIDDAARKSIEAGTVVQFPAPSDFQGGPVQAPPQLPAPTDDGAQSDAEQHSSSPPLTGHEHATFQRIGESLIPPGESDRMPGGTGSTDDPDEPDNAPSPTARPAPSGDGSPVTLNMLDRLPLGIIVLRDKTTLFANRTLWEMLGYQDAQALVAAGGVGAMFPDEDTSWSGRNLTGDGGRLMAARGDGGAVAVDVRLHSVVWAGATALMLSLTAETGNNGPGSDEIAEELAVAAARISELEAVLDTATDGVIVIDRQGTISGLNHSAEALFGIDSTDVVGHSLTELLAEESRRPALDYLDGLASNGVASVLNDGREIIGKVPRGGLIPLFMTMGRAGEGDTFYAVLRDITHWKNVEDELIAARRDAENANQQKSGFLAKISHEIRTPLNAIIGFSEVMMEERFGPVGNDRYRSYLKDIHTSGGHLTSLINDLLDLSKIEAGKLELNFESVAVNEAVQECVALMQPQANRERIIIRTSLGADVPNIVADSRSLRQILLNLVSNGIKFTRSGGQVIVSTGLEENGEVVLRVRDTGIGMSDKDVEVALQPFQQLATSKRESDRGTGLGLPLTKALVEANRASFAIDSALDQGTMVRITFPTTRVLAG